MSITDHFLSWEDFKRPAAAVRLTQPFEYAVQSIAVDLEERTSSQCISVLARIAFSLMEWPAFLLDSAIQFVATPIYATIAEGIYLREEIGGALYSFSMDRDLCRLLSHSWKPIISILRAPTTTLACWVLIATKIAGLSVVFWIGYSLSRPHFSPFPVTGPSSFFEARKEVRASCHGLAGWFHSFVVPNRILALAHESRELNTDRQSRALNNDRAADWNQRRARFDHILPETSLEELGTSRGLAFLADLAKVISSKSENRLLLRFRFSGDNDVAHDYGGPARQGIQALGLAAYRLATHMADTDPFPETRTLCLPKARGAVVEGQCFALLTQEEQNHYQNLGILMALCCYSDQAQQGYSIGQIFAPELFRALVALTPKEIITPFEALSFATQVKLCKALSTMKELNELCDWLDDFESFTSEEEKVRQELLVKLASRTDITNSLSVQELLEITEALSECTESEKANYLGRIQGPPSQDSALRTFVENLALCRCEDTEPLASMSNRELLDKATGWLIREMDIAKQLAPIHAIAAGFERIMQHHLPTWRTQPVQQLIERIQGTLDREVILNAVINQAGLKGEWLIYWLRHEATKKQLEDWLIFTTGSSSFTHGSITLTFGAPSILPSAVTCNCLFRIAQLPAPSLASSIWFRCFGWMTWRQPTFGHETKERFIDCVKEAIAEQGFGFG